MQAQEIIAAAGAEATARIAAESAKKAFDAEPENESLKTAYATAQTTATDAKTKLDALSQEDDGTGKNKKAEKIKRKIAYMRQDLKNLGVSDDDTNDDEDLDMDEIDPDKPLTLNDLKRIDARKASQGAKQMAEAITDSLAREAVKAALMRIVPSGDPQKDFTDAVAIASREKNSKILEEIQRKGVVPQHRSGAGSPPPEPDAAFEPTKEEARMMKSFGLTEKDIRKAREEEQASKK